MILQLLFLFSSIDSTLDPSKIRVIYYLMGINALQHVADSCINI